MKVLFLDVDGVLNRQGTKTRINGFMGLDPVLVDRFVAWCRAHPEVKIVLSSSWRLQSAFTDALRESLSDHGIAWVDVTPHLKGHGRGLEIKHWLDLNPGHTHIAILDDMNDMKPVGRFLVQTSEKHGVLDRHLQRVSKLLEDKKQ